MQRVIHPPKAPDKIVGEELSKMAESGSKDAKKKLKKLEKKLK